MLPERRRLVPYCLSCGRLRDFKGAFCYQCMADEAKRKEPDRKIRQARIKREYERAAARAAFLMPGSDTDKSSD